jgi:hypothetical protein
MSTEIKTIEAFSVTGFQARTTPSKTRRLGKLVGCGSSF